jgi:hypothetical protein
LKELYLIWIYVSDLVGGSLYGSSKIMWTSKLLIYYISKHNTSYIYNNRSILFPSHGIYFFLQAQTYIISLFNKRKIHNGNDSKVQRLAQAMTALASVWATIFACHLINFTIKFGLHNNILWILQTKELNSEFPPCKAWHELHLPCS